MALVSMKELLESGVHFGHRSSRWNPKMQPYIYTKRNLIHIIDLQETVKGLIRATNFLTRLCSTGEKVLLVGTKRQAKNIVVSEAKRCNMPYVAERWLGGALTNFTTIRSRLKRLHEIEGLERDGKISLYKKKEISRLMREKRKLIRNLDGIRDLDRLPGAVVVIDPARERNAVLEAVKLGIPTIGIVDTNGDPDLLDIAIPANDDAMRSIKILLTKMVNSVIQGGYAFKERSAMERKGRKDEGAAPAASQPAASAGDRGGRGGGDSRPRRGPGGGRRGGGGRGTLKVHPPRFVHTKKAEAEAETVRVPSAKPETAKVSSAKPDAPAPPPKKPAEKSPVKPAEKPATPKAEEPKAAAEATKRAKAPVAAETESQPKSDSTAPAKTTGDAVKE